MELVAGDLRGYRHGDVGWVADRPTFKLGGIEVQCRHTSVLLREDGEWRPVQHHFSIGKIRISTPLVAEPQSR